MLCLIKEMGISPKAFTNVTTCWSSSPFVICSLIGVGECKLCTKLDCFANLFQMFLLLQYFPVENNLNKTKLVHTSRVFAVIIEN